MKAKRLSFDAVFLLLAMALSYLETLLPLNFGVPGIKAGLPNLVIMFLLFRRDLKTAALVSIVRILLTGLLFGNAFAILYSLSGAIVSLTLTAILKKTDRFSVTAVSIAGGVAHNLGQCLTAMLILKSRGILWYSPALVLGGAAAGLLIGIVSAILIKRVPDKMLE